MGKIKSGVKLVEATIKTFKLDDVRQALSDLGYSSVTAFEVQHYGNQKGHTELFRGAEYVVDFLPKTKIEVHVTADDVEKVKEAIRTMANSGKIGDGFTRVTDLDSFESREPTKAGDEFFDSYDNG